jgi:hypothetical protein
MTPLPDDVRVLFDGANLAHVATLMPDGSPHSVPLWVGVEGSPIAFLTGPGARDLGDRRRHDDGSGPGLRVRALGGRHGLGGNRSHLAQVRRAALPA